MSWVDDAARLKFELGISWSNMPYELRKLYPKDTWTFEKVRSALRRHPEYDNYCKLQSKTEYPTKPKHITDDMIDNLTQRMIDYQKAIEQTSTVVRHPIKQIDDDKPIGIAFTADWHFGGRGVDHETLLEDNEMLIDTPGLYSAFAGDSKDNYLGFIQGTTNEQISPIDVQNQMVLREFRKFRDKMIFVVRGCHDDWDKRTAGIDFMAQCANECNGFNLGHGGTCYVEIGDQLYSIYLRHKFKGESGLNTTNVHRRIIDMKGHHDIAVVAHLHYPDLQHIDRQGGKTLYLRAGSYKQEDEFGRKIADYAAIRGIPMAVLFPDRKRIVPFSDIEEGIEYLTMKRANLCEV